MADYNRHYSLLEQKVQNQTLVESRDPNKRLDAFKLHPLHLYWIKTQTYLLCLVLFRRFIKFINEKRIDEPGYHKL